MANKTFVVQFGGGTGITGLNPTFIVFNSLPANGGTVWGATTPPGITEIPTTTGLYYFNYTPSAPVMFVIDGATTSLSLQSRYVAGNLDPIQQIDVQVAALGNTLVALGTSANAFGASLFATLGDISSECRNGMRVILHSLSNPANGKSHLEAILLS
jgi:hypothetical protein